MIFVTHDLGVAAQIADQVAVMYAGRIVEYGAASDVLINPQHPYTKAMLASTAKEQRRDGPLEAISGNPPDLRTLPAGCGFAPRCAYASPECTLAVPEPVTAANGHMARCTRARLIEGRLTFRPKIAEAA
jgi:peptide/nickel transport system ATP-binding protein